jgi:hypothetical protein
MTIGLTICTEARVSAPKLNSRQQSPSQTLRDLCIRITRGDWTPLELFIAGMRGWEAALQRRLITTR